MGAKEIREIFRNLDTERKRLTPYQIEFIKSLKKYFNWKGMLSQRQVECLENIKRSIFAEV